MTLAALNHFLPKGTKRPEMRGNLRPKSWECGEKQLVVVKAFLQDRKPQGGEGGHLTAPFP